MGDSTSKEAYSIAKRAIKVLREEGMIIFARESLAYIKQQIKIFILPYALLRIKNFNQDYSLDKLIDFAFNGLVAELIKPAQVRDEILKLLWILGNMKPKVVLEIGTANGGTLFLCSRISSKDATIISLDLPGGPFGGGYSKWRIPLYKSFALADQQNYLIRADSHSRTTLEKIKSILNGRKIDFLFIDGDHTYEGVKEDFEMYSPLVEKNGLIAFHDIVVHPPETGCEVNKFWKEIKEGWDHLEITKDPDQGWGGIGILFMKQRIMNNLITGR